MTLKERLQWALDNSNTSQAELARALNVSKSAVSQWLSGQTKEITPKHLFKAARVMGCDPEWLGTGKGPRTPLERHTLGELDVRDTEAVELARSIAVLGSDSRVALRAFINSIADPGTGAGKGR